MTKGKFMDAAVEQMLAAGPRSNKEMRTRLGLPDQKHSQTLDRSLQRLRKEGKLQLLDGRWSLSTCKVCSACKGKGWV